MIHQRRGIRPEWSFYISPPDGAKVRNITILHTETAKASGDAGKRQLHISTRDCFLTQNEKSETVEKGTDVGQDPHQHSELQRNRGSRQLSIT